MNIYRDIANSTLLIECGSSRGSGFHFIQPEYIITNYHVIEDHTANGEAVMALTDDGYEFDLELLASSPSENHDFAIFHARNKIPKDRMFLSPKIVESFEIGKELVFSGFPHGIEDLLVQRAIISGLIDDNIFYIDGSVNGGNSGGPIVDLSDGSMIGIVTERRFLGGADLDNMQEVAERIQNHCQQIAGRGSVQIMGIDFGGFTALMADEMVLIKEVIEANANTGIGIGYSARFVIEECERLGIR